MRFLYTLILTVFVVFFAKAQVFPPFLKCIQNDTLRWDAANNTCGAFQRYLIYGSIDKAGPYVQLGSISTNGSGSFYHSHPVGQTWYYFMQSRFDCPGQPIISSDTLTGDSPEVPIIRSVSVENGKAQVQWNPAKDKRIFAYIIYKVKPNGVQPIDTVYSNTVYIDNNSDPTTQREQYYVLGLDRCGNTSIFGEPQRSSLLSVKQDACKQAAVLTWNEYAWNTGVASYEIYVKVGNSFYKKVGSTLPKDTTFTYTGLKNKEKYCFYVKAIQEKTGYSAKTNELCLTGAVVNATEYIIVKNVTVASDGKVSFTWIWNSDAALEAIKIKRSDNGTDFKEIASLPTANYAQEITYTDNTATNGAKTFYTIFAQNQCGDVATETFFTTNIQASVLDNRSNNITWTPHFLSASAKTDYELYKVIKGSETKIWDAKDKNEFVDPFDPLDPDNAQICYYVIAFSWDTIPATGKAVRVRSSSNLSCVSQASNIFAPNAFAPKGRNQEFRPLISFTEQIATYSVQVFDRYGAEVFQTNDYTVGWNGRLNNSGREMPQDVYVYYVKIVQKNGKINDAKGTVTLLR